MGRKVVVVRCPFCDSAKSRVVDSRAIEDGKGVRRRRECEDCEERYTTVERVQDGVRRDVIKRDGQVVPFNPLKIRQGIIKARQDDDLSDSVIDSIVSQVERTIRANGGMITTAEIGDLVVAALKEANAFVYVRFSMVYKRMKETKDLQDMLKDLLLTSPQSVALPDELAPFTK